MSDIEKKPGLGPLEDPIADWPNDDLLLKQESRDRVARDHPSLLKVLDWPELRAEFESHDTPANEARVKCRRFGLLAVGCAAAGMVMAALAPVLAAPDVLPGSLVGFLAAGLTILGTGLGLAHWIGARHRSEWLIERFWTERLRQFHFQFLVNNFDLAVNATGNDPSLKKFQRLRTDALERLIEDRFRDVPALIKALQQDDAELSPWLDETWPNVTSEISGEDREQMLLRTLQKLRIGVQEEYAKKKLDDNVHSPKVLASLIRNLCDVLTLVAMVFAFLTGAFLVAGHELDTVAVQLSLGLGAVASFLVLALRVLDDGLHLKSDAERYGWYLSSLRALNLRFEQSGPGEKLGVLRELEHLSYQEMRRFFVAQMNARFLL